MSRGHKDWTILIYANGNNELEPEMWQAKLAAETVGSNEQLNVVMQIGRISRELLEIIRPHEDFPEIQENWTGVRRYYLTNSGSALLGELGEINLADPRHLVEFLEWAVALYPARHYLLVLAGHGVSCIGVLPDLSQDFPYMMATPQMCTVLNRVHQDTGITIDLLVLDICYMNTIEIMYELGREYGPSVKNVLTYINRGPFGGLPYDQLIHLISKSAKMTEHNLFIQRNVGSPINNVIKSIIKNLNFNLVAIKISHRKLQEIKKSLDYLAGCYISNYQHLSKKPVELIANPDKSAPWHKQSLQLRKSINNIILGYQGSGLAEIKIMEIITREMLGNDTELDYFSLIYHSFGFSQKNRWPLLLTKKHDSARVNQGPYKIGVYREPLIMPPKILRNWLWSINPTLNGQEIDLIYEKLFIYKNWDQKKILDSLISQVQKLLTFEG